MKRSRLAGTIVLFTFAASAAAFPFLPGEIPIHWDAAGRPDGWTGKWPGAFLVPAVCLGLWGLFAVLPRLDPRREAYRTFRDAYWAVANAVIGFTALVHVLALARGLGWPVPITRVALAGVGVLLVAIGLLLPRLSSNWWIGIRTPWTLESDEVWERTHRFGRGCFVWGGVLAAAAAFLPGEARTWGVFGGVALAAVPPFFYSYLAWRRLEGEPGPPGAEGPEGAGAGEEE